MATKPWENCGTDKDHKDTNFVKAMPYLPARFADKSRYWLVCSLKFAPELSFSAPLMDEKSVPASPLNTFFYHGTAARNELNEPAFGMANNVAVVEIDSSDSTYRRIKREIHTANSKIRQGTALPDYQDLHLPIGGRHWIKSGQVEMKRGFGKKNAKEKEEAGKGEAQLSREERGHLFFIFGSNISSTRLNSQVSLARRTGIKCPRERERECVRLLLGGSQLRTEELHRSQFEIHRTPPLPCQRNPRSNGIAE
jgi:hypothetical protein